MSDFERIRQLVKRHANSDERQRLLAYLDMFETQATIIEAVRKQIAEAVGDE